MWTEQLSNGNVKFVERYTDPLTLELHRVSCTMAKDTNSTRKQAQAILNEKIEKKLEKISMSAAIRKEKLRLGQLCTMYNTFQKTARLSLYLFPEFARLQLAVSYTRRRYTGVAINCRLRQRKAGRTE